MTPDLKLQPLSPDQLSRLLRLLEQGLPIHPSPYAHLAEILGACETQVLAQVQQWNAQGLFRRFGLVVRHRALGISANLMLVLDVPDTQVDRVGQLLGEESAVNLCYRRTRALPNWNYNLFCMMHGRDRSAVERYALQLLQRNRLQHLPHAMLFSVCEFKQRGARYARACPEFCHE